MKVLFVCMANIGRSQVSEVYFNEQTHHHEGISAGTHVDELSKDLVSKQIKDSPYKRSIDYIKEMFNVDISEKERIQLTPELYKESDMVIMILEKSLWPQFMINEYELGDMFKQKIFHWDIPDTPGLDKETTWEIWDKVVDEVGILLRSIEYA